LSQIPLGEQSPRPLAGFESLLLRGEARKEWKKGKKEGKGGNGKGKK